MTLIVAWTGDESVQKLLVTSCVECEKCSWSSFSANWLMIHPKWKELTLEQTVGLIRASGGNSQWQLVEQFRENRSAGTLKRKTDLMDAYEKNDAVWKWKCYAGGNADINNLTRGWFTWVVALNTPVSGPMPQEKTLEFAKQLVTPKFKTSNSWLHQFKFCHNIHAATLSGERASINQPSVDLWRERLPSIIKGHKLEDVFNMDETGLFFERSLIKHQ